MKCFTIKESTVLNLFYQKSDIKLFCVLLNAFSQADPKATVEKEINRIGPGGYFGGE